MSKIKKIQADYEIVEKQLAKLRLVIKNPVQMAMLDDLKQSIKTLYVDCKADAVSAKNTVKDKKIEKW